MSSPDADAAPPDYNGFSLKIPFPQHIGVHALGVADGRARLRIDLDERHHNSLGMAHGGVLLTLADVSMAMAASSQRRADEADSRVITIEMKTSFIGPGFGRLIASAVCVQRAGSIAFCETEVRDEKDRLVARASGTFKYVRAASPADSPTASAPRPTVTISESSST